MAIVDYGPNLLPSRISGPHFTSSPAIEATTLLMDAAGEKVGMIVCAPKAGTISKVAFRAGTVTTGGDADIRLETVSLTDGNPTGTLWGTTTNVTVTLSASGAWVTATLTAGATVARGDIVAVVIARTTGTYTISAMATNIYISVFPYTDLFTAAWAKQALGPIVALEYSDGSYAPILGALPMSALTNTVFNSGSVIDERGIKFRLPISVRTSGFWAFFEADGNSTVKLYDSDGTTVLASRDIDLDVRNTTTSGNQYHEWDTPITLLANTYYRLTLLPTTVTSISSHEHVVNAVALMGALQFGADFHLTTRADAGAWTDTTTQRPQMGLIIDGIDTGGGGGGLKTHPGMTGGLSA